MRWCILPRGRYHHDLRCFAMSRAQFFCIYPHLLSVKELLCNFFCCLLTKSTVVQSQSWGGWWDRLTDGWTYLQTDQPSWWWRDNSTCLSSDPSGLVTPSCPGKFLLFISPGQKMSISVLPSGLHNHSNILMKFSSERTMFLLSKQLKVHQSNSFWNPLGRQKFPDMCLGLHPRASAEKWKIKPTSCWSTQALKEHLCSILIPALWKLIPKLCLSHFLHWAHWQEQTVQHLQHPARRTLSAASVWW